MKASPSGQPVKFKATDTDTCKWLPGGRRQRLVAARGGGGRAALRGNTAESERRQRLLFGEVEALAASRIDAYVPDSNLGRELSATAPRERYIRLDPEPRT